MPFALAIIGIVLIITGIRGTVTGTNPSLTSLVKSDFTGQGNYIYWLVAILLLGSLGYIESLKTLSRAFMTLVVIVLFIGVWKKNPMFFTNAVSGIVGAIPLTVGQQIGNAESAEIYGLTAGQGLPTQQTPLTEQITELAPGNNIETTDPILTEQIQ